MAASLERIFDGLRARGIPVRLINGAYSRGYSLPAFRREFAETLSRLAEEKTGTGTGLAKQSAERMTQGGKAEGMQAMDDMLFALATSGAIAGRDAYMKANDKARFEKFAPAD